MLELGDGVGRPHVRLAADAVRVVAAGIEGGAVERRVAVGLRWWRTASSRDLLEPDALDHALVPVKYSSTNAEASPTASKICAPQYDWKVEMPILRHHLEQPLGDGLDEARARLVVGGAVVRRSPSLARLAKARLGWMASAP